MRQVNLAIASLTHAHVRKYYQTLHDNQKINWIAVSCATEEVAENFKAYGYDIPIYMSTEEMLKAHPEIDGVIIASENFRHYGDMELCCKYGKHMLSMKVPTFNLEEYDRMIEMVEKADVLCQVELEMHYNPTCARVLELVHSGLSHLTQPTLRSLPSGHFLGREILRYLMGSECLLSQAISVSAAVRLATILTFLTCCAGLPAATMTMCLPRLQIILETSKRKM